MLSFHKSRNILFEDDNSRKQYFNSSCILNKSVFWVMGLDAFNFGVHIQPTTASMETLGPNRWISIWTVSLVALTFAPLLGSLFCQWHTNLLPSRFFWDRNFVPFKDWITRILHQRNKKVVWCYLQWGPHQISPPLSTD